MSIISCIRFPSKAAGGGGTASWGSITGTLSNQIDLQGALGTKAPLDTPTFTGTVTAGHFNLTGGTIENAFASIIFASTLPTADITISTVDNIANPGDFAGKIVLQTGTSNDASRGDILMRLGGNYDGGGGNSRFELYHYSPSDSHNDLTGYFLPGSAHLVGKWVTGTYSGDPTANASFYVGGDEGYPGLRFVNIAGPPTGIGSIFGDWENSTFGGSLSGDWWGASRLDGNQTWPFKGGAFGTVVVSNSQVSLANLLEGEVVLKEITTPASNPPAGHQALYIDSNDHKLYRIDSAGTRTLLG